MISLLFLDNLLLKGSGSEFISNLLSMQNPFPAIWLSVIYLFTSFLILNFGKRTRMLISIDAAIATSLFFEKNLPEYTSITFITFISAIMFFESRLCANSKEFSIFDLARAFKTYIENITIKANNFVTFIEESSGLKYPLCMLPVFASFALMGIAMDFIKKCLFLLLMY